MPFTGKTFENLTRERKDMHVLVESYGFELLEQFIGYQNKEDFESKDYDPSFILSKDKNFIKESDVVIADFSSPSIGTDCEVTIAKELFDKKIYAVAPLEKRKHSWLKFYCDGFFDSITDALEQIRKDFHLARTGKFIDKRQYDPIAVEYRLVENTPAQKYIYDPILERFLSELATGKRVAVLHCNSGHRARMAKKSGAAEVLGVDVSHRQIHLAREEESAYPLGIEYFMLDPYSSDFLVDIPEAWIENTDIVLGFFLLDHAMNQRELDLVSKNIHRLLKPGGMFFALSDHPDACTPSNSEYGVVLSFDEGVVQEEGSPRRISIYQKGREVLHFYNFLWKQETIRKTFLETGFGSVEFAIPNVSEEGVKIFGEDFWEAYRKCPDQIMITAQK